MFRIHIVRNRQPIGQFTPEEVAEGLRNGQFLPTDLAWREPMDAWKALSEWDNLPEPKAPVVEAPPVPEVVVAPPIADEPAWERRKELGIFSALYGTVKQILSTPVVTFSRLKLDGGLMSPLFFYLIVATLTGWVASAYTIAAFQINPQSIPESLSKVLTPQMMLTSQILGMVLAPLFLTISAFLMAGAFHLVLMMLSSSNKGFEATFRAFCYAAGAASVMQLIPWCGGMMYLAVLLFLCVVALREVHRTDNFRATLGVVVPALLGCGFLSAIYGLAFMVAMQAAK